MKTPILCAFALVTFASSTALAADATADRGTATDAPTTNALPPLPSSAPAYAPTPGPADPVREDDTLIAPHAKHGGYGAPEMKVTPMFGEAAILAGGQAGWLVDHHLIIGAAGYGLTTSHAPVLALSRPEGPSRVNLGYGGVRFGWIFQPHNVMHLTAALLVGGGGLNVTTHELASDRYVSHDGAAFFALEPQAELEINVVRYARLAFGGSYRFLSDAGNPGMHVSDLSGPAASVALKFGVF